MSDARTHTDVQQSTGARAGVRFAAGVVVLLIGIAAAAPLLAGGLPYVAWSGDDAHWRLPLFRSLSIADWLWLIVPIAGMLSCCGRRWLRLRAGLAVVIAISPVVVAIARWLGGDAWLEQLTGQELWWWVLTIGLVIVSAVSLVVAQKRAEHQPGASRLITAFGVVVLAVAAAQLATADRSALEHWQPDATTRIILPPIHHDPGAAQLDRRLLPPGRNATTNGAHLLGTDEAGADVLARMIHATRIAVTVGVLSAGLAVSLGALLGLLMGFFIGWVDLIGMRIVELFMAVPRLLLILVVIVFLPARDSTVSVVALVLVIGLTGWMRPARLMRAEVMRLRTADYVLAAQAAGVSRWSLLTRHLAINCIGPVLVECGFAVSAAVLLETNLSFLGLGVPPSQPSWGAQLSQAINPATGVFHWWLAVGPGAAILATVLACNTLTEHARIRMAGQVTTGRRPR